MGINLKSHYVPRFYLKYWSCDDKQQSVCARENIIPNGNYPNWHERNVKSVCMIDSFYSLKGEHENFNIFEKKLSEIENITKPVIDKVINKKNINDKEFTILKDFILYQIFRVPSSYDNLVNIFPKLFSSAINDVIADINVEYLKYGKLKHRNHNNFNLGHTIEVNRASSNSIYVSASPSRSLFVNNFNFLPNGQVRNLLHKCHWKIVYTDNDFYIPTSDNPVVLVNYRSRCDYNLGLTIGVGNVNTNIFMPLSPHCYIITQVGASRKKTELFTPTWDLNRFFKKLIVENSRQYIISCKNDYEIDNMKPSVIDKSIFDEIKKQEKTWNDIQNQVE